MRGLARVGIIALVDEELAAVDDLVDSPDTRGRPRRRPGADAVDEGDEVGLRELVHRLVEPAPQRRDDLAQEQVRARVADDEVGSQVTGEPRVVEGGRVRAEAQERVAYRTALVLRVGRHAAILSKRGPAATAGPPTLLGW